MVAVKRFGLFVHCPTKVPATDPSPIATRNQRCFARTVKLRSRLYRTKPTIIVGRLIARGEAIVQMLSMSFCIQQLKPQRTHHLNEFWSQIEPVDRLVNFFFELIDLVLGRIVRLR